tara:strand:+ start:1210 stop:1473 length:264 start_codon:yes stop_codon:yes gene_type:complete
MKPDYELIWEMVYHNPHEVEGSPARLLLKLDKNDPTALVGDDMYDWLTEHKDQVSKAVVKAIKSKTNKSKYKFVTIFKIPFYTQSIN